MFDSKKRKGSLPMAESKRLLNGFLSSVKNCFLTTNIAGGIQIPDKTEWYDQAICVSSTSELPGSSQRDWVKGHGISPKRVAEKDSRSYLS
ncbi:hypothetical protein CDAR_262941 [Caerostris darwini]|uniref:Uncharacterized protein n=1 Tax=Caerostris darwini TaxID=1538125 RepID=A0AAV4RVX3_9ARAC|nr:hypothetical protein CDAR_262941 [Caerostris darwini]